MTTLVMPELPEPLLYVALEDWQDGLRDRDITSKRGRPDMTPVFSEEHLRVIHDRAYRLGVEAGAPKWLPIESAPKGRTLLIGYFNRAGKWRSVRGHYYAAETLESELDESGWAPEGWYEKPDNAEEINFTDMEPTHWQFLPSPPAQKRRRG